MGVIIKDMKIVALTLLLSVLVLMFHGLVDCIKKYVKSRNVFYKRFGFAFTLYSIMLIVVIALVLASK